jgi:tellurite resistance protein TerB
MSVSDIASAMEGKFHDPFALDQDAINALITAGVFVAGADGRIDSAEREEAVRYIERAVKPRLGKRRIAEMFDERADRLQDRDFAEVIVKALRPVHGLSLTSAVIEIAERVAAADGRMHPSETQVIRLIGLITMALPEPRTVNSSCA